MHFSTGSLYVNMEIEAKVIGGKRTGNGESDISEISDSSSGLSVTVETFNRGQPNEKFKIFFESHKGFRALEEGDLQMYENAEIFRQPYYVYQVLKGGWSNGEACEPDMLNVVKAVGTREWFIATTNLCLTVLSASEPTIENV